MPTSVRPLPLDQRHRRRRAGSRATARIVHVCAVARGSVCERVAREKSSKRSRSVTVRPTRPAARMRRVTRSTSATSVGVDLLRRVRRAGRARAARRSSRGAGRRAPAAGRGCARARAGAGPTPGRAGRRASPRRARATWPTVAIPTRVQLLRGHRRRRPRARSTGSGCRKSSSPSGRHDAAARRAWRRRSRPWRGTSSARRRP